MTAAFSRDFEREVCIPSRRTPNPQAEACATERHVSRAWQKAGETAQYHLFFPIGSQHVALAILSPAFPRFRTKSPAGGKDRQRHYWIRLDVRTERPVSVPVGSLLITLEPLKVTLEATIAVTLPLELPVKVNAVEGKYSVPLYTELVEPAT
jgi:hypothetical protein